eukprot:1159824-Pelagomonas_calceolata.AAC.2
MRVATGNEGNAWTLEQGGNHHAHSTHLPLCMLRIQTVKANSPVLWRPQSTSISVHSCFADNWGVTHGLQHP